MINSGSPRKTSRPKVLPGRLDEFPVRATTSKRRIHSYFSNNNGFRTAVLQQIHATLRDREEKPQVEGMDPVSAFWRLVEATFDAHMQAPYFSRLVMIKNIHTAALLRQSEVFAALNRATIKRLDDPYQRGFFEGLFRAFRACSEVTLSGRDGMAETIRPRRHIPDMRRGHVSKLGVSRARSSQRRSLQRQPDRLRPVSCTAAGRSPRYRPRAWPAR